MKISELFIFDFCFEFRLKLTYFLPSLVTSSCCNFVLYDFGFDPPAIVRNRASSWVDKVCESKTHFRINCEFMKKCIRLFTKLECNQNFYEYKLSI